MLVAHKEKYDKKNLKSLEILKYKIKEIYIYIYIENTIEKYGNFFFFFLSHPFGVEIKITN
jgi:hypothetical protein